MSETERIRIAHGEVFRRVAGGIEFLLMKRVPEDGGFWQTLTGTIENNEEVLECLHRELKEETGIDSVIWVSPEVHQLPWETPSVKGLDLVYAVEVEPDVTVTLDPSEHSEYEWLLYEAALDRLKYEGNKESMRQVHALIAAD